MLEHSGTITSTVALNSLPVIREIETALDRLHFALCTLHVRGLDVTEPLTAVENFEIVLAELRRTFRSEAQRGLCVE